MGEIGIPQLPIQNIQQSMQNILQQQSIQQQQSTSQQQAIYGNFKSYYANFTLFKTNIINKISFGKYFCDTEMSRNVDGDGMEEQI